MTEFKFHFDEHIYYSGYIEAKDEEEARTKVIDMSTTDLIENGYGDNVQTGNLGMEEVIK